VPVLMYHWVNDDLGDRLRLYGVTPRTFEGQVMRLRSAGYRAVPFGDLLSHIKGESTLAARSLVLTFDDGYLDNVENAAPVLEQAGWTATVFVVTDHMGGVNEWDLHHGDAPRRLMTWDDARRLDGKVFRFEPHSRTHPFLDRVPDGATVREEIAGSKKRLEDELGRSSRVFSYPHGVFDSRAEAAVREAGFHAAVTDLSGLNRRETDPFRIRRTMITAREVLPTFAFKVWAGFGLYHLPRKIRGRLTRRREPA
jgi:peptidoglycan/xylan/chitin deacetylase (PgdA/CDA1 family)